MAERSLDGVMAIKKLVLFPGALGDFLCFYPALQWLRQRDCGSVLELRLRGGLGELFCLRDASLAVASLESREVGALFVADAYREPALRAYYGSFDEIYSWTGFADETFRENLTRLAAPRAQLFRFRPESASDPMSDYYLACVKGAWLPMEELLLPVRAGARAWAAAFLEERGIAHTPLLALAPGSGAREKNWSAEHFAAVCAWWRDFGAPLLVYGPAERERAQAGALVCPGALSLDDLSLGQLAAVFARCRAMVGNDSGPTHLAAAVGIPTFAIFGPTDPRQWRPWGPRVTAMSSSMPCAPCGLEGMKTCTHRNCLRELRAEAVIRAIDRGYKRG